MLLIRPLTGISLTCAGSYKGLTAAINRLAIWSHFLTFLWSCQLVVVFGANIAQEGRREDHWFNPRLVCNFLDWDNELWMYHQSVCMCVRKLYKCSLCTIHFSHFSIYSHVSAAMGGGGVRWSWWSSSCCSVIYPEPHTVCCHPAAHWAI